MWIRWIFTFLLLVPSAWAFRVTSDFENGFYWANLPISMAVVDSNSSRKSMLESHATKAINEWQSKTGLSLWDLKTRPGDTSTNVIRWSENFAAETKMDPMTVLAVAIRYTTGPYFTKTEIVINGNHYLNMDPENLRTTITHELGHTMGLDHSDDSRAIMAPTLQSPYTGINGDDTHGMRYVSSETERRQITKFVSPLAYETETTGGSALSCGTVQVAGSSGSSQGIFSLALGLVLGFFKRILGWIARLFRK